MHLHLILNMDSQGETYIFGNVKFKFQNFYSPPRRPFLTYLAYIPSIRLLARLMRYQNTTPLVVSCFSVLLLPIEKMLSRVERVSAHWLSHVCQTFSIWCFSEKVAGLCSFYHYAVLMRKTLKARLQFFFFIFNALV